MRHLSRSSIRRLGLLLALGTAAAVALGACGTSTTARPATTTSVLAAATAAIQKEPSAHLSVTVKAGPSRTQKIVADSAVSSGMETIAEGTATATIRVTPTYGYISGTSTGLTEIFGLSAAEAKKVGTKWVSFPAGTSEYSDLKSGVTMASIAAVLPKASGTTLTTTVVNGSRIHVLMWNTAATSSAPKMSATLTISAAGATLPVEETATSANGAEETIVLSKWGEQVVVSAPPAASTVPYSSISG